MLLFGIRYYQSIVSMGKEEVEGENGKDGLVSLKYSFGGVCGREVIKDTKKVKVKNGK